MVDKDKLEIIKFARRQLDEAKKCLKADDEKSFMQCIDLLEERLHVAVKRLIAEYYCKASEK